MNRISYKRILPLTLAAAMALSLAACGGNESAGSAPGASAQTDSAGVAVQVEEVAASDIATENKVSGKVEADDDATVMVGVSAKCTAVYVEAGEQVQAGQALCTLDLGSTLSNYNAASISYNAAVQSYEDQAAVFEKQIALYEKNLNDLKALQEIGAAAQIEIDQADLQLQSAIATRNATLSQLEAGMQTSKSSVEQLKTVLQDVDGSGNVIAPISGTLVTFNASKDSYVSNTMPVAVIDGAGQMKVTVSVSETLVPKLHAGDQVDVTVSSAEKSFVGTIRSVEQAASAQTKLYTVSVRIPAEVEGLLSGMFADVTFHTDASQNTIVVPTEAILTSGATQYVFVVENGTTARYVEVRTGLTGNGVTEVTSGLTAGQQLVTVGQTYLTDGDAVRVVTGED